MPASSSALWLSLYHTGKGKQVQLDTGEGISVATKITAFQAFSPLKAAKNTPGEGIHPATAATMQGLDHRFLVAESHKGQPALLQGTILKV